METSSVADAAKSKADLNRKVKWASTLANGVVRAERQSEGATEAQGSYRGRGSFQEAGAALPLSASEDNEDVPWGGGANSGKKTGLSGYLESYDNVSTWLGATCDKKGSGWFIAGECENGHRFAKELVCGKEWCEVCGEDGSVAHMRRFARWLVKIQQLGVMGYFVFTIPEELRAEYRTKKALSRLGHQVQELLKAFGLSRGLRRWHFFGDKTTKYNPHLNCLVDAGYISQEVLARIKSAYAGLLGVDLADVNYRYRLSPGKMVHTLKYVTRATFRDYALDIEMALELRGFRNMVVWGRGQWDDAPVWSLADLQGDISPEIDAPAVESLAAGVCPVCGKGLTWGEALPVGLLNVVEKQSLGAGYWRLADIRSPHGLADDVKQRLYWLELIHRAEVQVAVERAEREAGIEAECQAAFWRDILK